MGTKYFAVWPIFHFVLLFAAVIIAASGCGPSLKSTMPVPQVKLAQAKVNKEAKAETTYLYIDEFVDKRDEKALARRDSKEVNPEGDIAPAAVDALKQALTEKGFTFSESAPVIISGEVREWVADVTGSLPTKVSAKAALYIEVLDPANKRIYSGVYRGFASMEEASVDEKDVSKTLASSLEESVAQIASDKQLVTLLSSY